MRKNIGLRREDLDDQSLYKKRSTVKRIIDEANKAEEVDVYSESSTGDQIEVFKDREPQMWRRTRVGEIPGSLNKFD